MHLVRGPHISCLSPSSNMIFLSSNAVYFNIWSACCYSTGNYTLPIFTQWTQNCTTSSIDVDSSTQFSEMQGNLGIDVPSWAEIRVPENTTFDIQRAVTRACIRHVNSSESLTIIWTCCSRIFYLNSESMDDSTDNSPSFSGTPDASHLGSCPSDLPAIPAQALARWQPYGMAKALKALTPTFFS